MAKRRVAVKPPAPPEAVAKANEAVKADTGGRQIKSHESDLRKKWMDAYVAAGGKLQGDPPAKNEKQPPDSPVVECDAMLSVEVVDNTGQPISGATVRIEQSGTSVGGGTSDSSGLVELPCAAAADYQVEAEKPGYGPTAGGAEGAASATVTANLHQNNVLKVTLHDVAKPTKIKAKVPRTKKVRAGATSRAGWIDTTLSASSSADESLAGNAPVILVRGGPDVELEVETTPVNAGVTWSVKPNENSSSPPTIAPESGGKKAKLKSNREGSFSVIAEIGSTKIVWNVVFVYVKVLPKTSVIKRRNNKYVDAGSTATWTSFRSGLFSAGNYAWEGKVKVRLYGGGKDKKLGIDKVKIRVLQNGVTDTLTGNYDPGETCLEVPRGGLPIVDCTGGTSPWIHLASAGKVTPNQTAKRRTFWSGDSPAGSFRRSHQNTAKALRSISGVNGFKIAVASTSDQAPSTVVVHAETSWSADYSGSVDASGKYTRTTASTTKEKRFKRISAGAGGKEARGHSYETHEPRFNGGTNSTWTP